MPDEDFYCGDLEGREEADLGVEEGDGVGDFYEVVAFGREVAEEEAGEVEADAAFCPILKRWTSSRFAASPKYSGNSTMVPSCSLELEEQSHHRHPELHPNTWELLVSNAGISSMHTAIAGFNTVVLLDRTDICPSRLKLPQKPPLPHRAGRHRFN
ncbi:hypothetical protein RHMOL_Rhmol05G0277500 [Rhododendron molle]|uniref:Uncharacterized protein n=1 Tax=Rhododendron molle TaxID=49168 RepID=A0ACC0NVB5_RHOML|nr:hypothetical protein RHMOL_Rhmol05G0277500 [Rhododendron molle]